LARLSAKVTLTEKQQQVLRLFSNSRTLPAHLQVRATIILYCSQGKTNGEIMIELGVSKKTVSKWRNRWASNKEKILTIDKEEKGIVYQRLIEKILNDNPRVGSPCKFTAEQICLIMNVACESPEVNDLPLSHWSLPSLANELVKRKIVDSISTSQLQVFLKSSKYKAAQSKAVDTHTH